jgi:hypothetical protein
VNPPVHPDSESSQPGLPANSPPASQAARGDFYVTGGTLRPDAPSYIERQADKDLCDSLLRGEFCYVLTSRQMGKSSLMVRTVKRLRQEKAAVAVLDLTAIGQNLSIGQWYDGLMSRLGQQLNLEDELLEFWERHPEWGPLQRWTTALEEVVLKHLSGKVVIFIDEIDIVRSLPFSTDEFFAAIRECYNRRSRDSAFARLAFGLLGVAAPNDLIRDTRMTPFNIGRRIELNDFTAAEAAPLARGLGADAPTARDLLARVLYWTGGHPYLTQRLCRALAEALSTPRVVSASGLLAPPLLPSIAAVDHLAEKLFLSRQARDHDDNLIFVRERLLRGEVDVAGLLHLYRKCHAGDWVPDDETNPLVSVLRLSGIARGVDGCLRVRNRIYRSVFDPGWIRTNMPEAEVRRQQRASRKGMALGFAIAVTLLLTYIFLVPVIMRYRDKSVAFATIRELGLRYHELQAYRDTFESRIELGVGGTTIPINGSGSLIFERPNKVNLALRSSLTWPEIEVRLLADGDGSWMDAPSLEQHQVLRPVARGSEPFDLPAPTAQRVGPVAILPVYRLLLASGSVEEFRRAAGSIHYEQSEELDGQPVRVLRWNHEAKAFLASLGITNTPARRAIPVTAYVNSTNYLVLRMSVDLSPWAGEILGDATEKPVTGLKISETHHLIQTSMIPLSTNRLSVEPPKGRQVDLLELPPPNFAKLVSPKREFLKRVPARLALAPRNAIDLSDYYNAALAQTWHPGMQNNTLDMLPPGLLQLDDVVFDVRGIVQLAGREILRGGGDYPQQISSIKVDQSCRQLHFLHACGWTAKEGTRIGTYIIHYSDGEEQVMPIVYGEDVRDWNASLDTSSSLTRGTIVWSAINNANLHVRLFKSIWLNPMPAKRIASIDYVSTMTTAAPFLIAITAEP